VLIDPQIPDDGAMSQVTRVTPDVPFPESEGTRYAYGTPWPLSEDYFLCNEWNDLVLLDRTGNKEFICGRDNVPGDRIEDLRLVDPIPLRPRPVPPVIPTATWQGERAARPEHRPATIFIRNCYLSDLPLPEGVKIKALRIVQLFPQEQAQMNNPKIGYASESLARMSLGTVPVENDGSVYCYAPVGKEIYFQLLDERGMAVQSMRSGTHVFAGEQATCVGCHENQWSAPPAGPNPEALRRPPSPLTPEPGGVEPINFHRLVSPILSANCTSCHAERGKGPDMSYGSLKDFAFHWCSSEGFTNGDIVFPGQGGSRTMPGLFGARVSKLVKYLDQSHYDVSLTDDEFRRIALWLDCNSNELGAYADVEQQKQGQLVWPRKNLDPNNPTGVE